MLPLLVRDRSTPKEASLPSVLAAYCCSVRAVSGEEPFKVSNNSKDLRKTAGKLLTLAINTLLNCHKLHAVIA